MSIVGFIDTCGGAVNSVVGELELASVTWSAFLSSDRDMQESASNLRIARMGLGGLPVFPVRRRRKS